MNKMLLAVLCAGAATGAFAALRPAYVFSDGMVLQAHRPVPVWGLGDPGERFTVSFGGKQVAEGTADAEGRWRVDLPAMDYVRKGQTLQLRGSNIVEFRDVLVGEVWLGSGQSNMEFALDNCDEGKVIAKGGVLPDTVRYLHVPKDGDTKPRDLFGLPRDCRWQKYTAGNEAANKRMSMLLTLFAKRLLQDMDVPLGLVSIAAGGANLETWMSAEALAEAGTTEDAAKLLKTCEGWHANDVRKWENRPEKEKGRLYPRVNYESRPSQCWNALACPVKPFAVRGIFYYQGEMNSGPKPYEKQYPAFVKHFRAAFEDPNLPFYIVQLPDFKGDHWPFIRDIQRKMSEQIPNCGLAVAIDGHEIELHPRDKRKIADRLARLVLSDCYGRKDVVARSPYPLSVTRSGTSVDVKFKYAADGLKLSDGAKPRTFELSGPNRKFIPAEAKIVGKDTIRLTVPQGLSDVTYVRYGWDPDPDVNLVNSADLPATPFEEKISFRGI